MEPQGIEPALRAVNTSADSGLLSVVLGVLVVCSFLFPTLLRLWRAFFKQLVRSHSDLTMQVERTINERVALFVSLLQTIVMEGLALFCVTATHGEPDPLASFAGMALLAIGLMAFQLSAYYAIGFAFSSPASTQMWIRSFLTTQSLAGYLLVIPALGGLFYPNSVGLFLTVCVVVLCACRILFYIRSFAFFYTSPTSLFYFFLYLCTVEIVPVLVAWSLKGLFFSIFT